MAPEAKGEQAVATDEVPTEVHINDVLVQLVRMLRSSPIYKPSVQLRTLCDDMIPPLLWGSRSILVRGLLNLISNALKFTDSGHVSVHTCLLSDPTAKEVRVRIDVVDTGRGMTETEMLHVRKPYVSGTRNGRASGLGLGLPIVIASIERAGGTFQMDSRVGAGTRCSFELRFAKEDPLLSGLSTHAKTERPARCKTVLIVDDVEMIRLVVAV